MFFTVLPVQICSAGIGCASSCSYPSVHSTCPSCPTHCPTHCSTSRASVSAGYHPLGGVFGNKNWWSCFNTNQVMQYGCPSTTRKLLSTVLYRIPGFECDVLSIASFGIGRKRKNRRKKVLIYICFTCYTIVKNALVQGHSQTISHAFEIRYTVVWIAAEPLNREHFRSNTVVTSRENNFTNFCGYTKIYSRKKWAFIIAKQIIVCGYIRNHGATAVSYPMKKNGEIH